MNATDLVDRTQLRDDIPDFAPGDTLKVHVRVVEGNRERVQVFQGVVIRRKGERQPRDLHRPQGELRRRRRAHVPGALADPRQDRAWSPGATCAGPSSTTSATGSGRPRRSRRSATERDAHLAVPSLQYGQRLGSARVSAEDLERYETEIELQLYKEYRDVLPMFAYVVETERRFYLTNEVKLDVRNEQGQVYFELELPDAWVWDMYRPARFVANVRVVTFKDVNIEELAAGRLSVAATGRPRSPARARRRGRGRWSRAGTRRAGYECSTATGAAARVSSTSSSRRGRCSCSAR